MKIAAIIPAYNEYKRLPSTLTALRSRPELDHIIVVDDGSTDDTESAARTAGADQVIRLAQNGGKGAALTAGCAALPADVEIVLLLDADLGSSATEFVKLLGPIARDEADMTIATLPPDPVLVAAGMAGGGSGIVVRLARNGIARRTGLVVRQPLSGQRAMKRSVVDALGGKFAPGFGVEVALTLAVSEKNFRIMEVTTAFRHRVTGNDWNSLIHRFRQLADVVQVLAR